MSKCTCPPDRHLECGCKLNFHKNVRVRCQYHWDLLLGLTVESKRRSME